MYVFWEQSIEENEVYLPNDELWIYEIDNGLWYVILFYFLILKQIFVLSWFGTYCK